MNNTVPSVTAAIRVVETLATSRHGMPQAALAKSLGLSASTCYRILQSLAEHGWVVKESRGIWRLGAGLLPVAAAMGESVVALEHCRAILHLVARGHAIACKLSVRRGVEQVVVARAEPASTVQMTGREGASFPIAEGSSGAALLCDLADDTISDLFAANPSRQTTLPFLRSAIRQVRKDGWCLRERITAWPISALSAPVRNASGAIVAALSFLVPEDRHTDPALPPLLLDTAAECGHAAP